ncbi:MAG: hypothetical protein HC877_18930 [Thioploca sp.]|nr:hypothetical protein [Thioploca sp.]
MPRIQRKVNFNFSNPWMAIFKFKFDTKIISFLKQLKFCTYEPINKVWFVPADLVDQISKFCVSIGYGVDIERNYNIPTSVQTKSTIKLFDFQQAFIDEIRIKRRMICAFETGLGKTITAIEALKQEGITDNILWISKRSLFDDLNMQFKKFKAPKITLVAWDNIPLDGKYYNAIIIDESHFAKYSAKTYKASARYDNLKKLLFFQDYSTLVIGLSATPFPEGIFDVHGVAELFWPGIFKSRWAFAYTYGEIEENEYGVVLKDINPAYADALNNRISYYVKRQTKRGLPVPIVESFVYRIKNDIKDINFDTISTKEVQAYLDYYRFDKIKYCIDTVRQILAKNSSPKLIVCFNVDIVKELSRELGLTYIVGATPLKDRNRLLANEDTIVCSIECINEGYNSLMYASEIIYFQLSPKTKTVVQSLGRLVRIGSKHNIIKAHFIMMSDTVEEKLVIQVMRKLKAVVNIIGDSTSEKSLISGLELFDNEDDNFNERINALQYWDLDGLVELEEDD